jgi:SpoVK/Ycf46/Vps4 family AAA+-type ATPase
VFAFAETLHSYLSTSYPFLWLRTWEEHRVVGLLQGLASGLQRRVHIWRPEDSTDPATALDAELDRIAGDRERSLTILVDAHPYLTDPIRVRRLRVLQRHLTHHGSQIAFVSPVVVEPVELAKDWTILDVPLPDRAELEGTLDSVLPRANFPHIDRERVSLAAAGLTGREAHRAYERAAYAASVATARHLPFDWEHAVVDEKRRLIASQGSVEFHDAATDLTGLGGLADLKGWLHQRRAAFGDHARQFGLPQPRGVLLVGVQGCGKSLAAKAVAGHWGVPLLRLDLGSLFSGKLSPDEALRRAIATAESVAPCVLWVDEIEKGFDTAAGGETTRLLGSLLTWLQEKSAPVFFAATANRVDSLPPELLRRGRFDEIFFVDLPDPEARAAILAIHLARRGRDPARFELPELLRITENYSGAELEQIVVAGLYNAFAENRDVEQRDLIVAARQTVPLYRLYEVEIKALRTWAQDRARPAGHSRKLIDLFGKAPPPS